MVNIGVLSAFIVICAAIIVLRRRQPALQRPFRTPWVPLIPLVGIGFSLWLILSLPGITFVRFAVWMALGGLTYFKYGRRHSHLNASSS